jgi:hypothetical protein
MELGHPEKVPHVSSQLGQLRNDLKVYVIWDFYFHFAIPLRAARIS